MFSVARLTVSDPPIFTGNVGPYGVIKDNSALHVKRKVGTVGYFSEDRDFVLSARGFILFFLEPLFRIATIQRLYSSTAGNPCSPPGCEAARLPQMLPARRQSSHPNPRRYACRKPPLKASPAPVASTTGTGSAGWR